MSEEALEERVARLEQVVGHQDAEISRLRQVLVGAAAVLATAHVAPVHFRVDDTAADLAPAHQPFTADS